MNCSKTLMLLTLCLAMLEPALSLSIISPALNGSVSDAAVAVLHTGTGNSCYVAVNGADMNIDGCVNFTIAAKPGLNSIIISNGSESNITRFTYTPKRQPEGKQVTPTGVRIRGRTPFTIPDAFVEQDGTSGVSVADLRQRSGKSRVELRPLNSRIQKISFEGVQLPQELDLGLEQLENISFPRKADAFAIDPTLIAFDNGTITKTAVGNRVYKCASWNFTNQSCGDDWMLVQSISPGEAYSLAFDAVDPAYVETFEPNVARDVALAALDNSTLVIASIDASVNASQFEIWHTNGVIMVDKVQLDTTMDLDSRITVEPINTSHFVIATVDGPEDDVDIYIADRTGRVIVNATQVDPSAGLNTDVKVCEMGDRFVVVWADNNDNDANYEIYNNTGVLIATESQVDTSITPGLTNQNLVDCAMINSSTFAYLFYDDADNDVTAAVVNTAGTIVVAATDYDNDVGETGQVAAAGLRGDRFAVGFYDSTDDDITITVRTTAGNAFSTILANTDIDTEAGADSRIALAEIENSGASEFVVAWQDTNDSTIKAAVYNSSGSQMTAPFVVTSTPLTTSLVDVIGYNSYLGLGLCNGTFAIAYTNLSDTAVFETYYRNGSRWDGICGAPDTTPPRVEMIFPPNEHTNDTSNTIDFYYNVSDENSVVNCSLLIDGEIAATVGTPTKDETLNITIQLSNGFYNWSVACTDSFLNTNQTEPFNLTVNVPLLISGSDVALAALGFSKVVIAFIDTSTNRAKFEIWNTNMTRLINEVTVDGTVDGDSRIATKTINKTHFAVATVDGPLDDVNLYVYDEFGNLASTPAAVDTNAGTNTDVDLCQLGDRMGVVWADNNDNDANFKVYNNTGVQIAGESQVDTNIIPDTILQNYVSCAALNSSDFGYVFFDDVDNDVTLALVSAAGTISIAATDLDTDVGERGAVTSAGLANDRIAIAFYDSTDQDITITVRNRTGTTFGVILANTDIDTDAGNESRVAMAEVNASGASDFVVVWQDRNDSTIKAAVYSNSGSQITAPFNISTDPSNTSFLLDVEGYNFQTGTGLCNSTFVVAYTNSSGNTIFESYFMNGTPWNGVCGSIPVADSVSLPVSIPLIAGSTRAVDCNVSVSDGDGLVNIVKANATLYRYTSGYDAVDNGSNHYTNSSCVETGSFGNEKNYTCSFDVYYYARNDTWYCSMWVYDGYDNIGLGTGNTSVDSLYAINISTNSLDFGNLTTGTVSENLSAGIENLGNEIVNVSVYGYGRDIGDGYSFVCPGGNISEKIVRFATNITANYSVKEQLAATGKNLRMTIPIQEDIGSPPSNLSYWQIQVPANTSYTGICNGSIVFQAELG